MDVKFREIAPEAHPAAATGHRLFPYPGRLIPHIPRAFFQRSSGLRVFDPFCGSGTTLFEAALAGHQAVGLDVNPAAVLGANVKAGGLDGDQVCEASQAIVRRCRQLRSIPTEDPFPNASYWYEAEDIVRLHRLRRSIEDVSTGSLRRAFEFAFVRAAQQMSLTDPAIPVPVRRRTDKLYPEELGRRFARFVERQQALGVTGLFLEACNLIADHNRALKAYGCPGSASAVVADSRVPFGSEPDNSADIVITSPPYLGAQKYMRSSSLALGWLGHLDHASVADLDRRSVGRERLRRSEAHGLNSLCDADADLVRTVASRNPTRGELLHAYLLDLRQSYTQMARAVAEDGIIVVVISEMSCAGVRIDLPAITRRLFDDAGLTCELEARDELRGRVLLTKRKSASDPVRYESVIVFAK